MQHDRAVKRVASAEAAYRAAATRAGTLYSARTDAVVKAREAGVTYREIAATMGMTIEGVQRMLAKVKP